MDKKSLRSMIKEQRLSIPSETLESGSRDITSILLNLPQIRQANIIMAYLALAGEVNLDFFIEECLAMGKKVAVPITLLKEKRLDIVEAELPLDKLKKGPMGIREPDAERRVHISAGDVDVVIVPGVAFDLYGGRLGYGGGFYDRFISGLRTKPALIGVCFDFQVTNRVPMEPCDRNINGLVTPGKFYWFQESARDEA